MKKELTGVKNGMKWGTVSSLSMIIVKVFRGTVIPWVLSVFEYGLFTSVGVFTRYLQFSDFGARAYFNKNFPKLYFNNSDEETEEFKNRIISFIFLSFGLLIIYLTLVATFYSGENSDFYSTALLMLIPVTIFMKLREFYSTYANCIQNYKANSIVSVTNDFLSLILTIIGIFLYGAIGGIFSMIITELCLFLIAKRLVKIKFTLHLGWDLFKDVTKYFKLFLVSIVDTISATVDQWFILILFTAENYGTYSVGLSFGWLMIAVAQVFVTALQPKLMALAGSDPKRILDTLADCLWFYFLACFTVIPFLEFAINVFVTEFLKKPEYVLGLNFYYFMIFSGMVKGAFIILKNAYIAYDKEVGFVSMTILNIIIYSVGYSITYYFDIEFYTIPIIIAILDLTVFIILYSKLVGLKVELKKLIANIILLNVVGALIVVYQKFIFVIEDDFTFYLVNGVQIILISSIAILLYLKRKNRFKELMGT